MVANMTPAQQVMYLEGGEIDSRTGKPLVKFGSLLEAQAFMRMRHAGI